MITGNINLELTNGILKPSAILSRFGNNKTPPQTSINAKMVPIEVKSNTKFASVKKIGTPTTNPVTIVENPGVLYFG